MSLAFHLEEDKIAFDDDVLYDFDRGILLPFPCVSRYSKVPPLRNCIIRNSGLILVNKIPVYKKLYRLIHVQFLLQWYIVIFYGIFKYGSNKSQFSRNKNESFKPKLL